MAQPGRRHHRSGYLYRPIPLPLDTLARENSPRGEGAATERRATEDRRPKLWKPLDLHIEVLEKSGGASVSGDSPFLGDHGSPGDLDNLGPACTVANMDAEGVERADIDAHEQGGTLPVVGAASALAEGTAGVGPAGEAETATTTEPEALVLWAQDKAAREVETPPREGEGELDAVPPQGEGMAKPMPS